MSADDYNRTETSRTPFFSIVIPYYNKEEFIGETVKSLQEQQFRDFECVLVDDHSNLASFDYLKALIDDPRFLVIKRVGDAKGANVCRNQGAKIARGQYLIFLDADDVLSPTCLLNRHACIESTTAQLYVFKMGRFKKVVGDLNEVVNRFFDARSTEFFMRCFLSFNLPWPITSTAWRRDFFMDVLFDENLMRFQDVDVHINALTRNPEVEYYPHGDVDCYYRESDHYRTSNNEKLKRVFYDGVYLITKWMKRTPQSDQIFLTPMLLFLSSRYCRIIGTEEKAIVKDLFMKLGNICSNNISACRLILVCPRWYNWLPWIDYVRQRLYYFGKLKVYKRIIAEYESITHR